MTYIRWFNYILSHFFPSSKQWPFLIFFKFKNVKEKKQNDQKMINYLLDAEAGLDEAGLIPFYKCHHQNKKT